MNLAFILYVVACLVALCGILRGLRRFWRTDADAASLAQQRRLCDALRPVASSAPRSLPQRGRR